MKRVLATLSFFAFLAPLACSEDPNTLGDATAASEPEEKAAENEPQTPPSTKKSDTSGTNKTADASADRGTPAAPTSCAATATKTDCTKCCGEQNDPRDGVKDCACNPGSKCQAACTANFCADKLPDIACGLCLAQDCKPSTDTSAAQTCLQQCQDKP
jgi:hypothetical protein